MRCPKRFVAAWPWTARKIPSRDIAACSPTAGIRMSRTARNFRLGADEFAAVVAGQRGWLMEAARLSGFVLGYIAEVQARVSAD